MKQITQEQINIIANYLGTCVPTVTNNDTVRVINLLNGLEDRKELKDYSVEEIAEEYRSRFNINKFYDEEMGSSKESQWTVDEGTNK